MAEGIKIRQLDATKNIVDSDVLVLDHITADDLTTAVTKQIRFDDFVTAFTSRDLVFSGNVIFNADISFDEVSIELNELADVEFNDLSVGDSLIYDGEKWTNGEGTGSTGDYIALESNINTPVTIKVTVGDRVNHRLGTQPGASDKSFYLDGREAPFFILTPGNTYIFDQSDISNRGISDPDQYRLRLYAFMNKGVFNNYLTDTYVEYSSSAAPGEDGCFTKLTLIDKYPLYVIYYQAEKENYMGDGLMNPDGEMDFVSPVVVESLQQQIDELTQRVNGNS